MEEHWPELWPTSVRMAWKPWFSIGIGGWTSMSTQNIKGLIPGAARWMQKRWQKHMELGNGPFQKGIWSSNKNAHRKLKGIMGTGNSRRYSWANTSGEIQVDLGRFKPMKHASIMFNGDDLIFAEVIGFSQFQYQYTNGYPLPMVISMVILSMVILSMVTLSILYQQLQFYPICEPWCWNIYNIFTYIETPKITQFCRFLYTSTIEHLGIVWLV